MGALAITAIGDDRPGIVAAVTEVLAAVDANLEDTSMTILRGHFAMMLIVGCDRPAAEVEAAVAPVAAELDLVVSVREVATVPRPRPAGAHYVVTVHGADRPGIVARISRVIAAHGGNVTDLVTRLAGNLYVLTVEIDLPSAQRLGRLRRWQVYLHGQHVEVSGQPGHQVGNVAAVGGDHPTDPGHDAGAVGAVHRHHVVRPRGRGTVATSRTLTTRSSSA